MKLTRTIIPRMVLAILFALCIVFAFGTFRSENRKGITKQNEEFISELTIQGVKSLDSLLAENLGFIRSTAYLYGESLTSPWADVAVIRDYEENSVFDRLSYIDASGDNYTSRGVMAYLSEREYFQAGMKGESGIAFVPESRITGRPEMAFYAPVYYEGEIIGVMVGYYFEEYIRSILEFSLFGYEGESWLCAEDGTVIGSTMKESPRNILDYLALERDCPQGQILLLKHALSEHTSVTFTYRDEGGEAVAYGQSLNMMPWTLIRDFPSSAAGMLLDRSNRAGRKLLAILIIAFLVFGAVFAIGLILELMQKQETIRSTERDPLTGLYNRQYFYHYVEQYDQHHKNTQMDAVVVDVDHFQMINERYGRSRGDEILKQIAQNLLEAIRMTGGVLCRREADVFMMYCPHREDYHQIQEMASVRVNESGEEENRLRLRIGIYANVDKNLESVRRFDRAKTASDTIRGTYQNQVAWYDDTIYRKELFDDRLISDFGDAIRNEQFRVFLQPKFDLQTEDSRPAGAEALVRWEHPGLGLLGPGAFIPLFEKNGLIRQLDRYVWQHTARLMGEWKKRSGQVIPVSVNISRADMYDQDLVEYLSRLIEENGLTKGEFLLEITESAYMEDSAHIIETARLLREEGFRIEMDDFGTGYSSLNMINDLPIDVLKVDMAFVRAAFRNGKDTRMLEIILDIARYLAVPVIAEGVENYEQMETLKQLGCDYVQGYYYSRPIPPEDFERVFGTVPCGQADSRKKKQPQSMLRLQQKSENLEDLLAHLPGLVFLKDAMSGKYLACNHEFAEYAHKESPEGVIGLTDHEIFDKETADHFVEDDRKAVNMSEPHVFYENVPDAAGKEIRNLQTTKLCFEDAYGRLCVLGLCTDITQVVRMKEQTSQMRLAFSRIFALTGDYIGIYTVDPETEQYVEYSATGDYAKLNIPVRGENFFAESRRQAGRVLWPEDVEYLRARLTRENVFAEIQKHGFFSLRYRLNMGGKPLHVNLKAVMVQEHGGAQLIVGVNNIEADSV